MSGQDVAGKGKILMVVGNTTVSPVTGWPVGFWWAELTHPYWEFTHRGYAVEMHLQKEEPYKGMRTAILRTPAGTRPMTSSASASRNLRAMRHSSTRQRALPKYRCRSTARFS